MKSNNLDAVLGLAPTFIYDNEKTCGRCTCQGCEESCEQCKFKPGRTCGSESVGDVPTFLVDTCPAHKNDWDYDKDPWDNDWYECDDEELEEEEEE